MAKYELVVTSDNVLSSPLTLTVLDLVGPRGETGPTGPTGPAGATTFSSLTDVDTDSATTGQLLQADGDDTYSFVTVAGATNTLDDVTSNNNTTTNDISVGGVTATSLNTHTIPSGTGTLALSSDIPTVPTNNNQLTNGAGYITGYTVTQGDVTAHQAQLSITESQISDLGTYLTVETNDLSSAVTWANVPDANITQSSVTQHQAQLSITESQISDHGTYATLVSGTVPASQLPSYVDDVEEYATYSGFPGTGEAGKIYVDLDNDDIYRWSGSQYVQINDAVSSADQATKLATARTISLGGDVTGFADFDGTVDITITAAVADDSHNHIITNVDGLQAALNGKLASTSTTDNITEGSSNLYYTDARANSAFDIRIATKDTDDLSEGSTNLYYTDTRFNTQLGTKDTGDLSEGTNLYYTDARVLTKINATSIDALNDVDTTTATPSDGQVLTWDNTAGYWKPSTVSGGGGGGSGDITSVEAGSGLTGGASTGDATLNVGAGSFITVAADTVAVDATDANTASKVVARDTSGNFSAGTITASLTGNVTGTVSDVSNHDTDGITEGSTNLYYTDARSNSAFDTRLATKSTSDLSEGTNLYYTNTRADARIALQTGVNLSLSNQDTDDLNEGAGNLYYTTARSNTDFDTRLATKDTDDVDEGSTNLYYTDARANAAIDARVDEDFINALNVEAASADTLTFTVKNSTGSTLEKGSVVYVSGLNGNTPEVSLARANSSSTMPAFGLVEADIVNTSDGVVTTFGSLTGLNVADYGETGVTFSLGDTVYVSSSEAGKLTNAAPAGETNLIQNIGKIERATPTTNMTIKVGGAGRTNATPNLDSGDIFIGNGSNKAGTSDLNSEVRSRVSATGDLTYTSGTGIFNFALSDHDTGDLSEGGNLYYTNARADARVNLQTGTNLNLSSKDTDDLSEGTNLYYTDGRAQAAITGGTGVTVTSGTVAIGQSVANTSNVTFNNVNVDGNLTVSGTTTTVDTETINLADNQITLNSNATGSATENSGIEIERGDDPNKTLIWNETDDKWTIGTETFVAATFEGNLTGNVTGTVSALTNHDTDDLAEGATSLYYTNARFDTRLGTKDTDNLSEGSGNLYYTNTRADSRITNATGVSVQAHSGVLDATTASYTTAEETKLSGIEASADVTDTDNVVAALTAGSNISIANDGTISATDTDTQRPIHDTPVDGATTTSISSNWAFDNVKTLVPSGAVFTDTNTTYTAGDGLSLTGTDFDIDLSDSLIFADDGSVSRAVKTDANGAITDAKGDVRDIPASATTGTLVIGDAGKYVPIGANITVPANIFSVGDAITIYNNTTSSKDITQPASGVTLRLAGDTTTGTRALAAYGLATLICVDATLNANVFICSGVGLT